jgi:hypothetical protein
LQFSNPFYTYIVHTMVMALWYLFILNVFVFCY